MRLANRILIGLSGLLLVLGSSTAAGAHTELLSANPTPNSTIRKLPAMLELDFSEPPIVAGSYIRIEQPNEVFSKKIVGRLVGNKLKFKWPAGIQSGTVVVHWRAVADDGHVSADQFLFTLGDTNQTASPSASPTTAGHTKEIAIIAGVIMLVVLLIGTLATTRRKSS
ncbi:MAG: copper resistance protein CopC [Actinobacteria bacterium]|nr:copper resistance protein CopC [Actinomycetota bacterium]